MVAVIYSLPKLSSEAVAHSERRLFTGFVRAALMDWKLIVARAVPITSMAAMLNIHQVICMCQICRFQLYGFDTPGVRSGSSFANITPLFR